MKHLVRQRRKERGLTLKQLADKVGKTFAAVQKVEVGERSLDDQWLNLFSKALGYSHRDFFPKPKIPKEGYIGTGMMVSTLRHGDTIELIDTPEKVEYSPDLRAYDFIDDSCPPYYAGSVCVIDEKLFPKVSSRFAKPPYWVRLRDGRIMIRSIVKGDEPGRYHLVHPNGGIIEENQEIESYAEIVHMGFKYK